MEVSAPHDPEFDAQPAPPVRLVDPDLADYQLVIVNPFLAILALVAWMVAFRWMFGMGYRKEALFSLLALFGLPWTIQFHCLDCGGTGIHHRLRRHICPGIIARRRADGPPWMIVPRASTQMLVWWYVICAGVLIWLVVGLGDR